MPCAENQSHTVKRRTPLSEWRVVWGWSSPPNNFFFSIRGLGNRTPTPDSPAQDVHHDMLCTFSLLSKSFIIFLFNAECQLRLGRVWGRERPAQQDDFKDCSPARV